MLLYKDSRLLNHDTGHHPESAARIEPTLKAIQAISQINGVAIEYPSWEPATLAQLQRVHPLEYTQSIEQVARSGGGNLDPDTVVSSESFEVARLSAGAVCDAVRRISHGPHRAAFCLIRPPGHHALSDRAMGFCLFNNIAVGAREALDSCGFQRVLIVDWDVHHGNGTQDIFYADKSVPFFSMHRQSFYPFTGSASETGFAQGLGANRNVPIQFGTPRAEILATFQHELEEFAALNPPDLVMISAGFDAHRDDPVGSLGLLTEDFAELTAVVCGIANRYAQGKIVSVLEGGYHPQALAESVLLHLQGLATAIEA